MKFRFGLALALMALVVLPGTSIAKSKHLTVTMNAVNGSGQSGTATIAHAKGGNLTVTIDLNGEPAGASEPAHIHPGSCANLNPIPKVSLTAVADGRSVTTIPAPAEANPGARAIVVHKGTGPDLKTYVSCGDIPTS